MDRICTVCGESFQSKTKRAKYCSKVCANHSRFNKTHEQIRQDNEVLGKQVLNLYRSGLNDRQIAEKVGRSITWIYQTRKRMGLPRQKSNSQRERERLARWREEFQKEQRVCKMCKAEFSPVRKNQLFCCPSCEKKNNHQVNDIKRKRLEKKRKTDDISLNDVFLKYRGICYLCGGKCDLHAVKVVNGVPHPLGDYPSREHIIPLSKGGLHTWDNIQLAHIRCNASKGVRLI